MPSFREVLPEESIVVAPAGTGYVVRTARLEPVHLREMPDGAREKVLTDIDEILSQVRLFIELFTGDTPFPLRGPGDRVPLDDLRNQGKSE